MEKNEVAWCKLLRKVINSRIEVALETKAGKVFGSNLQSEVFGKIFNVPVVQIVRKDVNLYGVVLTFRVPYKMEEIYPDNFSHIDLSFFDGKDCWFKHSSSIEFPDWRVIGVDLKLCYTVPFEKFPLRKFK